MSDFQSFLISISDGVFLYRVALKVKPEMFTGDALEYPLEPENKAQFKKLLPLHIQTCGNIVEIEEIFDVIDLEDAPNNLKGVV